MAEREELQQKGRRLYQIMYNTGMSESDRDKALWREFRETPMSDYSVMMTIATAIFGQEGLYKEDQNGSNTNSK